ncbi:hypothetical protein ACE01N_13070 [Saccharicrinis sp. FJH2]|uniref:hypothetical protein n=1 Tax=Saccharicrinis sp. FJH65 TaxID=3344659 RepID=UPI0035F2BABE
MNSFFLRPFTIITQRLLKNYLPLLLFGSLLAFISCDSEPDEPVGLRISNSEISVSYNDSVFTGAQSDYEIYYDIDNQFIASISGDNVIGEHVGKTTITAISNGVSENILVNVQSVNHLFEYPINDYSNGKEFYKDKFSNFNREYEDDTTLVFFIINYEEREGYYLQLDFTSENKTKNAILTFRIGNSVKVFDSLSEYFEFFDDPNDTTAILINAYDPLIASELSVIVLDKPNQICMALITETSPGITLANKNTKMKYTEKQYYQMPQNIIRKSFVNSFKITTIDQ